LKWCLFFNLLIAKCEIFPMFNSLLNCENVIWKMIKLQNTSQF
jgi:hypothetical protein